MKVHFDESVDTSWNLQNIPARVLKFVSLRCLGFALLQAQKFSIGFDENHAEDYAIS